MHQARLDAFKKLFKLRTSTSADLMIRKMYLPFDCCPETPENFRINQVFSSLAKICKLRFDNAAMGRPTSDQLISAPSS